MPVEIRYLCVAADHRPRLVSLDFGLTVHLREWAFCPAGERRGHAWSRVEGLPLDEVMSRTAKVVR